MEQTQYFPQLHKISQAKITLGEILSPTPLAENPYLSGKYNSEILLKREDLQIVRSYKIRGAYNKIRNLTGKTMRTTGGENLHCFIGDLNITSLSDSRRGQGHLEVSLPMLWGQKMILPISLIQKRQVKTEDR